MVNSNRIIATVLGFLICMKLSKADMKSACFNTPQKTIEISCQAGHMLRITRAFYGHSSTNSCAYQSGDCILPEKENFQCVGHESCSINLPSGRYGRQISSCGRYSTYFQVEYECNPTTKTQDICAHAQFTGQKGYISTPRYPNNYHGPAICETSIQVNPNQKIDLYIIDMDIEKNGSTGCVDWMYVYDNYRSFTLCGQRGNETFTSMRNEIKISFKSDTFGHQKGFWLYYEAFPPLPEDKPMTTEKIEKVTGVPGNSANLLSKILSTEKMPAEKAKEETIPVKHYYHKQTEDSDTDFPFAAIIAGVIGTLVLILAILLVLLLHLWWKERSRRHMKEQFLEIRNPAFRSSGSEFPNVDYYSTRPQESFYC